MANGALNRSPAPRSRPAAQDHVAVALAGAAQGAQSGYQPLAVVGGVALEADRAERGVAAMFNQFGDLERRAQRPGNAHSADGWKSVLKPVLARYRGKVSRIYFRADAGFANPEVYEYLEAEGIKYAIRLPANRVLQERIGHLLTRPVGRPPNEVRRSYANFAHQAGTWTKPRRVVAKVEWHPGELYPRVGFIVTNMARPAAMSSPSDAFHENPWETCVLRTENSAYLGVRPRAGPPGNVSTSRGGASSTFRSCQSLAMDAVSASVRLSFGECRLDWLGAAANLLASCCAASATGVACLGPGPDLFRLRGRL
jgi:hypothetical protein